MEATTLKDKIGKTEKHLKLKFGGVVRFQADFPTSLATPHLEHRQRNCDYFSDK
jgi:hypothetical protein